MRTSTKVCVGILTVMVVGTTALGVKVKMDHSGKTYYTCLVNQGEETGVKHSDECIEYKYEETAFDEDGNKKDLEFYSYMDRSLREGAYLSVVYNDKYGVISYQEVQKEEIPEKAMKGLETESQEKIAKGPGVNVN